MIDLPPRARVFVGVVIAAGVVLFIACLPSARVDQPFLFAGLVVISALSASLTESLPRATTESTMSVAFAVDFAALVLLGPHQAMVVAMGGVLSQFGLQTSDRTPLYRSLFNAASLVITIQATGAAMGFAGGAAPSLSLNALARSLVGAAAVYFLPSPLLLACGAPAKRPPPSTSTCWMTKIGWSRSDAEHI